MKRQRSRKCLCCGAMFRADPRNVRHQKYCLKATCRKASKAASQRRWLAKPENRDYFRGPENVARVQEWRTAHPGYWRRLRAKESVASQDDCSPQVVEPSRESTISVPDALQEVFMAQPAILIGLIAHLSDSALQEDIVRSTRRLLQLGQDILSRRPEGAQQTSHLPRASP